MQNPKNASQYRSRTPSRKRRGDCARSPSPRRPISTNRPGRPADQRVLDHEEDVFIEYEEFSDDDPIEGPKGNKWGIQSRDEDFEIEEERFVHLVDLEDEDDDEVMMEVDD